MEANSVTKSHLIGAVLIEKGLITRDQLDLALALQAKSGERLGEIVVAEFDVSRLELAGVLAEQWSGLESMPNDLSRQSPPVDAYEPLTPDEVQIRRPIGEIFVELGFVTNDQLEAALASQGQSGARIGEILVEQGSLTRLDLASALFEQSSALQSIRPSQSAASFDSQLQQGVTPLRRTTDAGERSIDPAAVGDLDERLRLVESTASAAVSQADLSRVQIDLRAAIGALETRIEASLETAETKDLADALRALLARVDALEDAPAQDDLAAIRHEIEDLRTQRVEAHRFAELTEAVERLEQRTTRVEDIEALAAEIGAVTARLDGLADVGELRERVDAAAAQTEATQHGLLELSSRLEPLVTLEDRLLDVVSAVDRNETDELVGRLESLEEKNRQETEHLDRLAAELAGLEAREDMSPALDVIRGRLDDLGRSVEQAVDAGVVDDLRASIQEISSSLDARALEEGAGLLADRLAAAESRLGLVETFDGRLSALAGELEKRPEGEALMVEVAALREELGRVAASVVDEKASLAEVLASRGSLEEQLGELRLRLDEVRVSPSDDEGLRERVEMVVSRLDELGRLEASVGSLREMVSSVDTVRSADALAIGERLAGVEGSLGALAGLESGLREEVARALEEGAGLLADRLAAAESRLGLVETFDGRLSALAGELEKRPEGEALMVEVAALREELGRVAASVVDEKASLAEVLASRGSLEEQLGELRLRLDEVRVSPSDDEGLRERVEMVVSRLDELGRLEASVGSLREMVSSVDTVRSADALAIGERLAGVEGSLGALAGLESGLREEVARALEEGAGLLADRLAAAESRLGLVETFDGRLSALAGELEKRPEGEAIDRIQARLDSLAERSMLDELDRRLSELAGQQARIASDAVAGIEASLEELGARYEGLSGEVGARVDELVDRVGGLVAREELDAAVAGHAEWLQSELAAVRASSDARSESSHSALEAVERRLETDLQDVRAVLDTSLDAVRSEFHDERQELRSLMSAQDAERAEQRTKLGGLDEAHAETVASVARVEQMLADDLAALSARFTEELAAARGAAELAASVARGEATSLSTRVDEFLAIRDADIRAARVLAERTDERLDELVHEHESDLEASRYALGDLTDRLARLSDDLRSRVEAAQAPVERLEEKLETLRTLRDEDSAAIHHASGELAEKLDALASRCEAVDSQSSETRDELRAELDRLTSSIGWRLEKIEESLAADDSAVLRATVDDLERRLEGQIAVGESQVRATERALRKGLASLGNRLVETESAYVDAGNKFHRAIERLGAAVVEADARMADQIPASPLDGCVAFAPTADGYRLIELPGAPPDVGSTVEPECCDGPLIVTRYGLSPLPLDGRPCAYLDHTEARA